MIPWRDDFTVPMLHRVSNNFKYSRNCPNTAHSECLRVLLYRYVAVHMKLATTFIQLWFRILLARACNLYRMWESPLLSGREAYPAVSEHSTIFTFSISLNLSPYPWCIRILYATKITLRRTRLIRPRHDEWPYSVNTCPTTSNQMNQ